MNYFLFLFFFCLTAQANDGTVYSGSDVKLLRSSLDINGNAKLLSGTVDPTSIATNAPKGSLYLNTSTGLTYRKGDSGTTANWTAFSVGTGMTSLNGLSGASQTFANDTNVIITSSGTTHTLGWAGQLGLSRGGTNANITASNGSIVYSSSSAMALSGVGTSGQLLTSVGAGTPTWLSVVPIANGGTNNGSLSVSNGGVVYTDGSKLSNVGVGTSGQVLTSSGAGTPTWSPITSSSGISGINFVGLDTSWALTNLTDRDAETSVGNWLTYNDGAVAIPIDMFSGVVSNITFLQTITAGQILNGTASFAFTKAGGVNNQGEGAAVVANIPSAYQGKSTTIKIPYRIISGTIVSGDLKVFIYDQTNGVMITPSNNDVINGTGTVLATFTSPSNIPGNDHIRVGIHIASTTTANFVVSFDDIFVGPDNIGGTSGNVSGIVAIANGGTNNGSLSVSNGGLIYADGSKLVESSVGTSGQLLTSGGAGSPTWTTTIPIANGGTNNSSLAVSNGGIVYADGSKLVLSSVGTTGQFLTSGGAGTPTWGSATPNSDAWAGYHASTCSWSRSNTAFGDPTADSTCSLTETNNNSFGTVTSYKSGSDFLPGIIFTPSSTGYYFLCISTPFQNDAGDVQEAIKIWDGTTIIAEQEQVNHTANNTGIFSICGLYNATSTASKTISIQIRSASGTMTLTPVGETDGTIYWTIFKIK